MAASSNCPRATAPAAAIVISVPTPILPFTRRRRVEGTNVQAATSSAPISRESVSHCGPPVSEAIHATRSRTPDTAAARTSLTCQNPTALLRLFGHSGPGLFVAAAAGVAHRSLTFIMGAPVLPVP